MICGRRTALREYRLETLPVVEHKNSRKLVGCLRFRRLLAFIFQEPPRLHDRNNRSNSKMPSRSYRRASTLSSAPPPPRIPRRP